MSLLITNHPTYTRVIKLLDSTVGRDKLLRVIQYFARFLSYYLYRQGYSKYHIERWKTLQSNLVLSRKLFRIGKPLSNFKAAATGYHQKTADAVLRSTSIIKNIAFGGYLTLDSLVWLHNSKVRPFNTDKFGTIQRTAHKFWILALFTGVINSLYRIQQASKAQAALLSESEKDTASIKKVALEKNSAIIQLVWDALDSTIPLTALKVVNLDDGVVGIAGLITSFLGLKQVW